MENKQEKNAVKSKILMALLSLVIAFGLWLYVVTVVSPESEKTIYNIPVSLQGENVLEERGLMVTTEEMPTVKLRIKGNRTDLDKLNSSNVTVVVDVSGISEPDKHSLGYAVSFPTDVPNNAVSTQKRTPDTVTITVEERETKPVAVSVEVDMENASPGFKADTENVQLSTDEIMITGPKRIISQVERAVVVVDIAGKEESINNQKVPYVLVNADGEHVDDSMVEDNLETPGVVTIEKLTIGQVKEISLMVNVVEGGGADSNNTEVMIAPQVITVFGSLKRLEDFGDVFTVGTVELGKLHEDTQLKLPIQLPEGITSESGETEAVVDVKLPQLSTKTLRITEITLINKPANMSAQTITKVLEVKVRGDGALVDAISEHDIRVEVDLKGASEGTQTMPVTIIVADGFNDIGVVGTNSVSVALRKQ